MVLVEIFCLFAVGIGGSLKFGGCEDHDLTDLGKTRESSQVDNGSLWIP